MNHLIYFSYHLMKIEGNLKKVVKKPSVLAPTISKTVGVEAQEY